MGVALQTMYAVMLAEEDNDYTRCFIYLFLGRSCLTHRTLVIRRSASVIEFFHHLGNTNSRPYLQA